MPALEYKKLHAIVETTHSKRNPLDLRIRLEDKGLELQLVERENEQRTLATAPFDPLDPDEAAVAVARKAMIGYKLEDF